MDSVGVCGTIEKHGAYIFALQFVRVGSVTDANIVTEILIDENADEKREDHPQIKDKDNHDKHLNKWARQTSKENKRAKGKSDTMLAVVIRCSDVMATFSQRRFPPTAIPHLLQHSPCRTGDPGLTLGGNFTTFSCPCTWIPLG